KLRQEPRRRDEVQTIEIHGIRCADGRQTLIDLAAVMDDDTWEQVLESALRKRLVTIAELEDVRSRRIRRVLGRRPPGAPPTESLLETLMVQLCRQVRSLPTLERQVQV